MDLKIRIKAAERAKSVAFSFAVMLALFFPHGAHAIQDVCGDCHTMHNSQDGAPMARDENGDPLATPYSRLLVSNCVGCHTSATTATIVDGVPMANNILAPVNILAAGNFHYVNLDDAAGHNVFGSNPDDVLGNDPPGGGFPAGGDYQGQLRCAGTRGCHGYNGGHGETPYDDQLMALDGAHHENLAAADGSTVGASYRFLYGIAGMEDGDWEQDNLNSSHNEYMGSTDPANESTIDFFCAECHGEFHGAQDVGGASPWLRHPTSVALPVGLTEYEQYLTYSLTAPVARQDPFNVEDATQVTPGTDMVMCLSCHRAHGSPNYKMMRWDYRSGDLASALAGCKVCHTFKD